MDAATAAGTASAAAVWAEHLPATEAELLTSGLGVFTAEAVPDRPRDGAPGPEGASLAELVDHGWLRLAPVVYEDFLPRSAAGIFQSNLTDAGSRDDAAAGADLDAAWLEGVLARPLLDPTGLGAAQRDASVATALARLGLGAGADAVAALTEPSPAAGPAARPAAGPPTSTPSTARSAR